MDFEYTSISGWILLGLMTGLGPCLAHQLLILLPYLGIARTGKGWRIWAITSFTLGRAGMYGLSGLLAGLFGWVFLSALGHDWWYLITQLVLGSLLIGLSLIILFRKYGGFCQLGSRFFISRRGHTMFLAGALTALAPCPALFGLFIYSAATGEIYPGLFNGLAFALGTSLVPILAGLSLTMLDTFQKRSARLTQIVQTAGGFILFGYGLHLLLRTILHQINL